MLPSIVEATEHGLVTRALIRRLPEDADKELRLPSAANSIENRGWY